jgi:hypothetical protein
MTDSSVVLVRRAVRLLQNNDDDSPPRRGGLVLAGYVARRPSPAGLTHLHLGCDGRAHLSLLSVCTTRTSPYFPSSYTCVDVRPDEQLAAL